MLRFILGRLAGSMVVIWIIVTFSFFLMRFAPGSPFDEDRKLPPAVEANKWIIYDMGKEVLSPHAGIVTAKPELIQGAEYEEGTVLCTLEKADGSTFDVVQDVSGRLVSLLCEPGDEVGEGQRVAVIPKSLFSQYLTSIKNYAMLDFGKTISSDGTRSVSENLALGFPISLELGLWAMIVALILGVGAGLLAGLRNNTWVDYTAMSVAMIGISVPTIVSGPLFIYFFVHGTEWFPFGGWGEVAPWGLLLLPIGFGIAAGVLPKLRTLFLVLFACSLVLHFTYVGWETARAPIAPAIYALVGLGAAAFFLPKYRALLLGMLISIAVCYFLYAAWPGISRKVLPILTLGFVYMASFARLTRGGMLEIISSDYIRTARAKGLNERDVVLKHAFKGAFLPTVSFLGPAVARIVTGSIVVERVFSIPGLADYFVVPALNRDYPMVLGVVVVYSALLIFMNLLVDIAYTFLDPRVTYD